MLAEDTSNWAEEVELLYDALPSSNEMIENGYKIVTKYQQNQLGKKVKIVRTFKIEKRVVSKSVLSRRSWKKFGDAVDDIPGTTIIADDVSMQFIRNKEVNNIQDDEGVDKLKFLDRSIIKCRFCSGHHWTTLCSLKNTLVMKENTSGDGKSSVPIEAENEGGARYVAPSLRKGTNSFKEEIFSAIKISNLSDSTTENDLAELTEPFGPVQKIFLAKEKRSRVCKGFAFVHFKFPNDAARAISALNGHGYDHLILDVEWSKPFSNYKP